MIEFTLNGKTVSTNDSPDTPLLWVVRDTFKLKGSKFGCGAGLCGACTMHVDGAATKTCVLPVGAVAGKAVLTIEGLGTPDNLHPLQAAWHELSVPQCGYCQSGQIMAAAALLATNPHPDAQAVEAAMAGNICRCGCYTRIKRAILEVAGSNLAYDATRTQPATEASA
ncbi:MAG: (2Fe-2S)-binding protein [Pseudomonadales bacterium]|nr:(2Fe-2S)-binding protein [Pseudomonadales bacterium]MCP5186005.1 (2Fe-2S)-binding protein [Pseudomonadales bacterium]